METLEGAVIWEFKMLEKILWKGKVEGEIKRERDNKLELEGKKTGYILGKNTKKNLHDI
jgi:hypothetical protein